jgi:hypothetical protein
MDKPTELYKKYFQNCFVCSHGCFVFELSAINLAYVVFEMPSSSTTSSTTEQSQQPVLASAMHINPLSPGVPFKRVMKKK